MNPLDSVNIRSVVDQIGQTLTAFGENHLFGRDAIQRDFVRNQIAGYMAGLKTRGAIGPYDVSNPKLVVRTWENIYPDPVIRERAMMAVEICGCNITEKSKADAIKSMGVPVSERRDYYIAIWRGKNVTSEYLGSDLSDAEIDMEVELLGEGVKRHNVYSNEVWTIEVPGEYMVTDVSFRPTKSVTRIAITAEFPTIGDFNFKEKK